MKNAAVFAAKLKSLLRSLPSGMDSFPPVEKDPVFVLILSFFMENSTTEKAVGVMKKLKRACIDTNDLRVTTNHELIEIIGSSYPQAEERLHRLCATLNDIYEREHRVSLERFQEMGKREIRHFLETLDGITPYVAERVMLVCYDIHAVVLDERLQSFLIDQEALDESMTLHEHIAWMARQIRSAEGIKVHAKLQRWSDGGGGDPKKSVRKSPTKTKTTGKKKTTTS